MDPSSDRTFLDQWTDWLATDAPRRLAPATIGEYKRQVVAFAHWMDAMLGVSFHPEYITAYRIEQYGVFAGPPKKVHYTQSDRA
jgi:hypothetical protein